MRLSKLFNWHRNPDHRRASSRSLQIKCQPEVEAMESRQLLAVLAALTVSKQQPAKYQIALFDTTAPSPTLKSLPVTGLGTGPYGSDSVDSIVLRPADSQLYAIALRQLTATTS